MFNELIFNRLTDEQKAFVEDFDHSILVSASAGTGKTTTMIRKILYLLLVKKIDVTNLLVVTYTTASASKMKHDLYLGLQSALAYAGDDTDIINYINKQIDLLNNADIGTIHAFCNKIIKKYFYQIGVDPNYSILSSEKAKTYLIDMAISKVFENCAEENFENFFALYENFNTDRSDFKLRNCIISLYEYLICRENSNEWVEKTIEEGYKFNNSNVVWEYLLEYYKLKWSQILSVLQSGFNLCDGFGHDKAKAFMVARIDFANKILEAKNLQCVTKVISFEKLPNKPVINTTKDPTLIVLDEELKNVSKQFKDLYDETSAITSVFDDLEFEAKNEKNKINAKLIYWLCVKLKDTYDELKKENNILDFNDLEHYATKLCKNEKVLNELKSEYKYIFVDEYQDVNHIQENIISSISQTNNLYMIGDVKQSIYRFRQSSPEIFLSKYNDFKCGVGDKRLILFNKNFRSDANILEFVNNVFDVAITKDCVGVDYKSEARLISGLHNENNTKHTVNISLLDKFDIKERNKNIEIDDGEEVTKREYEARLIATKISEIINKGQYTFKDIAILTRDKKDLAKNIWIACKKYNIPVTLVVKGNIFQSNEVIVLHSLLQCLYNEDNDIAFATLLKSPIIACSDNDLALIRACSTDSTTFYEACLVAEASCADVGAKITLLRRHLKEIRLQCLNGDIGQIIRKFVADNYLDVYYKGMPDGIEKECYINEFLNIIDSTIYENNLGKLLDYIEVIKERETEITISGGSDAVTLMTMHSSKGLDFPVVIVGGVGDNIIKPASKDLSINKDFGIAVTGVSDGEYSKMQNINTLAIALKNRKEEFEESIRLLYVALTRPKKELYITGVADLQNISKQPIFACKTYLDVIMQSISDVNLNAFVNKKESFELTENNAYMMCEVVDIDSLAGGGSESHIIFDVSNPTLVNALRHYHNKEIKDYTHIAFKNSVTSILKEQEADYTNALEKFKNLQIKESLNSETAMELGTQYHNVMQFVDYCDSNQDIKKLLDSLVFAGKINPIYLNKIDVEKIKKAKECIVSLIGSNGKVEKEKNFLTLCPHKSLIEGSDVEEDVLVQGVIDLSILKPTGAIIVDFKTNRTTNKQYLIDTYKTQLDLYAKSYEMAYKKSVIKKYLYSFEIGELIEVK